MPLLCAAQLRICIRPVFNGVALRLTNGKYITPHGDTVSIDAFRFYITNLSIAGDGATTATYNHEAWLWDAEDTTTWTLQTNISSVKHATELRFLIGVDSLHNVSGANSGDLDPIKGMYWAWNSGYIMARLEGRSSSCPTRHHAFEFHIGGYMPPFATSRNVQLSIPAGTDQPIIILADVAAWFSGNLDLKTTNSVLIPGKDAAVMAGRYARMFSIQH